MTVEDDLSQVSKIIQQSELELKSIQVNKAIPLEIDLGNLLATDVNEFDKSKFRDTDDDENYFKLLARDGVQCIINKIWDLPSETIDNMIYAVLPKPSMILPREKPAPKPRPPTKWEEYAKSKGIQKKKKGNKVWDHVVQDWVPRYGYKKAALERQKNWMMEVPSNADPYEDQFAKASEAKKERIARNDYLRLRNIAKAKNVKVPKLGITSENMNTRAEMNSVLRQTRVSTASLGKFQKSLEKEKPLSETKRGEKRKLPFNDTTATGLYKEKSKSLEILRKMRKPEMDYETAVNKQIKIDNIELSHPDKKGSNSKRRSKQGGRRRGKSERKALAKGTKPLVKRGGSIDGGGKKIFGSGGGNKGKGSSFGGGKKSKGGAGRGGMKRKGGKKMQTPGGKAKGKRRNK